MVIDEFASKVIKKVSDINSKKSSNGFLILSEVEGFARLMLRKQAMKVKSSANLEQTLQVVKCTARMRAGIIFQGGKIYGSTAQFNSNEL